MYIPKDYVIQDPQIIYDIVKKYSFGTLICDLQAAHLPFNIHQQEDHILLEGHLAISNPLVDSDQKNALCIFQGPHDYISTTHYERVSVPTWDYIAVHCYGTFELLSPDENIRIVEDLMKQTEYSAYLQWLGAPEQYKKGLQNGIRSFRIKVNKIEAAAKLSQNRSFTEKQNIIQHFETANPELADWMKYFNTLL